MAMVRKSTVQHPISGRDLGHQLHSAGAGKLASLDSSASGEESTDSGFRSLLRKTLLKIESADAEKAEDTGEGQSGHLHHRKTASAHPGVLSGFNSMVARGAEAGGLDYDSGYEYASTSSFEFQDGDRGAPPWSIITPYIKSAPSKWDDAQKWLVSQSPGEVAVKTKAKSGPLHGHGSSNSFKRAPISTQQDWQSATKNGYQTTSVTRNGTDTLPSGDIAHIAKAPTASHPEQSFDYSEERMKKVDAVKGQASSAQNFAFIPVPDAPPSKATPNNSFDCYPVADEPADMKEVNISHEGNDDRSFLKPRLRTEKPTSDSIVSAAPYVAPAPAVRSVSMRDMGTEMTPIASQEPSRTGTPIRATTPTMRSPASSCPSTPRRTTPAPLYMQHSDLVPDGDRRALELSEREMHKTRREIKVLGAQLGKVNIATWASKEEEDADASKLLKNIDLEEVKKNVLETRAAAWEEAEQAKYMARFKREEAKIQAWENHERAKAEAEMRRIEVKVERTRSHAHENLMNKLAAARRQAEDRRAAAEAKRCEQAAKTSQRADYIRRTGRVPSFLLSCSFCH